MTIKYEPCIEVEDEKITKTEIEAMNPEQFKMLGGFLEEKVLEKVALWWDKANDSCFSAVSHVQKIQRSK